MGAFGIVLCVHLQANCLQTDDTALTRRNMNFDGLIDSSWEQLASAYVSICSKIVVNR